jgi:hypothetical protein
MKIKPAGDNSIYQRDLPYFNNTLTHDYQSDKCHKYIEFTEPREGAINEATFLIINQIFREDKTRAAWKKDKNLYTIATTDKSGSQNTSKPLNYIEIVEYIRNKGKFDSDKFNLPEIRCFWLDFSLNNKINWHAFDKSAPEGLAVVDGSTKQQYGKEYPIIPKLVREGHSYTTLQPQLLYRITSLRNELILNSELALTDKWIFDLRTLINDTISIVDITLNQLYIKAEYDPFPSWKFDLNDLGSRYARRFKDKIGWIYKITGNHLEAEKYLPSCNILRKLRNHMMHFDPPSLVITIEEATKWLNYVIDVGWLLIKIRQTIGAEISTQLINYILQKEAVFNPESYFKARLPIGIGNADYKSCTWGNNLYPNK